MHKSTLIPAILLLTMIVGACASGGYKRPSVSGDPAAMSAETLCFRYGSDKDNEALRDEINARNLDCFTLLEDDPLYHDPSIGMGLR